MRRMIMLRKKHPVFRRRHFFQGRPIKGAGIKDIFWLNPDGREMTDDEWKQSSARCLGVFLAGDGLLDRGERGEPITDDNFLLLMNAHHENEAFTLPAVGPERAWRAIVDTSWTNDHMRIVHDASTSYDLKARSLVLLIEHKGKDRRGEQQP
jgi:isoamylase